MYNKLTENKKGFTLIEILVAVLIIGVLAAIALPGYRKAVEKAKAAEAVGVLNDAAKAEQDFALVSSRYTSYWDDLIVNHPNVVAGTVYCLKGANTANQDDCGNDSSYKVKLTVNDNNNSVVMATRMPNNPYADYKLFKFMNGDPNIYCKAATTSPTDICKVLGFPTHSLPETRNVDRVESFTCADEVPDCSVQGTGCVSGISSYNNCEKTIYDDGSFDRIVYSNSGNVYDIFNFDSEGNQRGDTWYFEDGEQQGFAAYTPDGQLDYYAVNQRDLNPPESAYVDYDENGKLTKTIWSYKTGVGYIEGEGYAVRTYDSNGTWSERVGYYADGAITNYRKFDTSAGGWGYFAEYNNDGSIKRFTCYTSMCGTPGSCEGAACATSGYTIPSASNLPKTSTYITQADVDNLCGFYSTDMSLCQ